ncbi:DASS family sodium-coupled anion symporter [Levilactobacillus yiduensis]|uniref:DASS family sodium-coupled anion symporter n=1 Tax=Levilactobacillus yiduensis TaxID=2953880 RepID=UPI001AD82B31|nr:DASS family sodium-coupled anion symporter [Levilactobacillus yiduensis]
MEDAQKKKSFNKKRWVSMLISIILGIIIWFIPVPGNFSVSAWHLFAIFVATAFGFMLRPFPSGVVTLIALTMTMVTGILQVPEAFEGFSSDTIWLIVSAFLFSRGLIKTGLGRRIAYFLMARFGSSSLKLSYSLSLGDLIISAFVPSNTARSGGIMYPIVRSIAGVAGSEPDKEPRKIGAYLIMSLVHNDNIASGLTMTACAGNLLVVTFAAKIANIHLSWFSWFLMASVPALVAFIATPWILYKIFPPTMKKTPEARIAAQQALSEMGKMSSEEKLLSLIFAITIIGWATTGITGLSSTVVALVGLSLMTLTGILKWQDITTEKGAWDVMFWMGGMYSLADNLSKMNFFKIFAQYVARDLHGISWPLGLAILIFIFIATTYGFASGISHLLAMYPVFLTVAIGIGVPPFLAVMSLGICTVLYQTLTHYASGPAAVYFGGGYVEQGTWWRLGIEMLLMNFVIWGFVGFTWWKILGLW